MKNILNFLILFFTISLYSQQSFRNSGIDGYKYIIVEQTTYKNSKKILLKELKKAGYIVFDINDRFPKDLEENPNLALYISSSEECPYKCSATIYLNTNNRVPFWQSATWTSGLSSGVALKKALGPMIQHRYKYNPESLKSNSYTVSNKQKERGLNIMSEKSIRDYFDKNGAELIEGIWEYAGNDNSYKLVILKNDFKFNGIIIESNGNWNPGEIKTILETAASDEVLTVKWTMADKRTVQKSVGTVKNNALINFTLPSGDVVLYKVYPKLNNNGKKSINKTGEWAGNGSGIIISKSGYIATNHHVIEDVDKIEVEFNYEGEKTTFNAEIVQIDKTNDLAIIKIFDMKFDGLENIPYNFKTRSSDVGTDVFALGYPKALTSMGTDIKFTDGRISSKSGFQGDITTYQTTTAIQPGNSGGPLFDTNANLIGINSAKIVADDVEGVSYSIKTNYLLNLIDVLPKSITLPNDKSLSASPLTEQIKELSKYTVLIKVK